MKRANGTGSIIRRRDKKRRRPYSVYLDGGHDPDTFKRKRIFLGSFEKFSEAQDYLEKYRHGIVTETNSKEIRLSDVWELYKSDKETVTGRQITGDYVSVWKQYIGPKLGNMDISMIKTMHMQGVINSCKSPGRQHHIRSVFTGLFAYALANDLVAKDYAAALHTAEIEKSTLHKPFTTAEMRWLWQHVDQDIYKVILIQTYTGARKADLTGILLENVFLKEKYMIGGVKTKAGRNRIIPIADCILPLVRYFYTISKFSNYPRLLMPDNSRNLRRAQDHLNIDKIYRYSDFTGHTTHDARHTFVSMADNYGIQESVIKKIVGHKSNDVTASVYTHKSLPQLLAAVNRLPYGVNMYMNPEEADEEKVVATG